MIRNLLISILFLIPLNLYSKGHDVGNGGHLLECQSEDRAIYKFYDLFYLKRFWDPSFRYENSDSKSELELAKELILKFAQKVPNLSKDLTSAVSPDGLIYNMELVDDLYFLSSNDMASLFIPRNCSIKQLAVQMWNPYLEQSKLYVDKTLFEQMSFEDKVSFYIHEVIYGVMDYENATKVRELNYLISAQLFDSFSDNKLMRTIRRLGLQVQELFVSEILVDISPYEDGNIEFYENGNIKFAKTTSLDASEISFISRNDLDVLPHVWVEFYENRMPKYLTFKLKEDAHIHGIYFSKGSRLNAFFYDDGSLMKIFRHSNPSVFFSTPGTRL